LLHIGGCAAYDLYAATWASDGLRLGLTAVPLWDAFCVAIMILMAVQHEVAVRWCLRLGYACVCLWLALTVLPGVEWLVQTEAHLEGIYLQEEAHSLGRIELPAGLPSGLPLMGYVPEWHAQSVWCAIFELPRRQRARALRWFVEKFPDATKAEEARALLKRRSVDVPDNCLQQGRAKEQAPSR
jgi:hypothetical protein